MRWVDGEEAGDRSDNDPADRSGRFEYQAL